jgi:hypothetical protein
MIINNTGFSSIKIFCESKSADVNSSTSRKIWSLQNPIVLPNNSDVKMLCSVESCSIPLSYYTINETNNKIKINGQTFIITNGNYNATSIITEIESIQQIFTISYSATTSKFRFSTLQNAFTVDDVENNAYDLLGIISSEHAYTTLLAPHPVNLVYTSGIYVSLNNVENNNIDTGTIQQTSTCLLRIPINQPTNTYLQYFNNVGFKNLLSASVLNQVDLSILDDNRKPLALTSNVNWVIVLRIDFEKGIAGETVTKSKIQQMKG